MNRHRPACRSSFLSGVYGIGAVYDRTPEVAAMQTAMRALARTNWPAVDPGRVDGELDQVTVQALANAAQSLPGLPSSAVTLLRYGVPAALIAGWTSSAMQTVRGQIKGNASMITKAVQVLALRRGSASTPPAPASSGGSAGGAAGGAQPMSLGLKVGIGVGGLILLLALS